jgi:hypothetical protein
MQTKKLQGMETLTLPNIIYTQEGGRLIVTHRRTGLKSVVTDKQLEAPGMKALKEELLEPKKDILNPES